MYIIISIFILAIVTYIPRVVPLLINKEIKSNYIKSVLYYMPYAVLGAMTFPAIFYSTGTTIASLTGTAVGIFLAYKEQSLVKVAIVASMVAYLMKIII